MDSVEKGFKYLINAYSKLRLRNNSVCLKLIGRPPRKIPQISDIHLNSSVADREMPAAYRSFDIFVQSSIYEPFGLALVEAMACGVPVIATRVGAIPEIIEDNINGLLVEPDNAEALASKIQLLADRLDLRAKLSEMGRKNVEERFSLKKHMQELLRVYKKVRG